MNRDDATGGRPIPRRRFLAAIGGTSLAGCVDQNWTENESITDSSAVFGYPIPHHLEAIQFNPWAGRYPWDVHSLFFETESVRTPAGDRQLAGLIDALEIDGATVTVTYNDEFRWWNGEPVTARDRWVADRIQRFVHEASGDETTAVRSTPTLGDGSTLVYDLADPLDRPLVVSRLLDSVHNVPAWFYEPWLERFEGATTDAALEAVVDDLRGRTIPLDEAMDEGIGCGPYELSEVSRNRLLLERFDEHPRAEDVEIPRLWLPFARNQKADQLVKAGSVDGRRGLLADRRVTPPDAIEQLAEYRAPSGTKIALNWRNDHLAQRGVRRAIACLLPIDRIVELGGWGAPVTTQTGLAEPCERRWLDDAVRDRLHRYPVAAAPERAAEYMRAAGYTRDGDRWRDEDGRRVELRVRAPLGEDWNGSFEVIEDSLRSFGFVLGVKRLQSAAISPAVEVGDFDLLLWWYDGDPYFAYDVTDPEPSTLGYGVADGDAARSRYGKPIEPSVPTTPGDVHADEASRERIDLIEQWRRVRQPSTVDETADAVATIARWWNDALPDLELATDVTGVWGNTRDFSWPADGDVGYRVGGPESDPIAYLLKNGAIRPAGQGSG